MLGFATYFKIIKIGEKVVFWILTNLLNSVNKHCIFFTKSGIKYLTNGRGRSKETNVV